MHTYKSDQCDPIYKCMLMMMLYDGHYNEIGYFFIERFYSNVRTKQFYIFFVFV